VDTEKFKNSPSGRILKTPRDYWAYTPNPLPPEIAFSAELVQTLSAADRALGELVGISRTLPNPHLLIRPFIRREAVLSSRIEGTQASLSDLLYFEAAGAEPDEKSDAHEVFNYVIALEYGLERHKALPMSLRLLRELHERLLYKVRGHNQTPGQFRRSQNWIGRPGCTLNEAIFVPPPVDEMKDALDAFEKHLHEPSSLPPLVRLALIHYQFEVIHPFLDGNGRVGRLLIVLLLCEWKVLPQPLLYLSAFFEKHRDAYYDLLLSVSQRGTWADWIAFFLTGVTEQARDAVLRTRRLHKLNQRYRRELQSARTSALLLGLIDMLFEAPTLTVGMAKKQLNVTYRSAQHNIDKLVQAGILREVTGRARNRVFVAQEVLEAIDKPLAKNLGLPGLAGGGRA